MGLFHKRPMKANMTVWFIPKKPLIWWSLVAERGRHERREKTGGRAREWAAIFALVVAVGAERFQGLLHAKLRRRRSADQRLHGAAATAAVLVSYRSSYFGFEDAEGEHIWLSVAIYCAIRLQLLFGLVSPPPLFFPFCFYKSLRIFYYKDTIPGFLP